MSNLEIKYIEERLSGMMELILDTHEAIVFDKSIEEIDIMINVLSYQFKDLCSYETGSVWPTEQYIRNRAPHLHEFFDTLITN
jgi:hypothetical protein